MKTEPEELPLILKSSAIDFELCELLGEKPSDFVVICIDGKQVPFLGTPWDSPRTRESYRGIVKWLNDGRRKDWAQLFATRKHEFIEHYKLPPEATAETFRPKFSLAVSRVCSGYSKYLHVAIGLFATLGDRVKAWSLVKSESGMVTVGIVGALGGVWWMSGVCIEAVEVVGSSTRSEDETPDAIANLIVRAVRQMLLDLKEGEKK